MRVLKVFIGLGEKLPLPGSRVNASGACFLLPQSISLFVSVVLLLFMLASSDASQFAAVGVWQVFSLLPLEEPAVSCWPQRVVRRGKVSCACACKTAAVSDSEPLFKRCLDACLWDRVCLLWILYLRSRRKGSFSPFSQITSEPKCWLFSHLSNWWEMQFRSPFLGSALSLEIPSVPSPKPAPLHLQPSCGCCSRKGHKVTKRNALKRILLHMLSLRYHSEQCSSANNAVVGFLKQMSTWKRKLVFCTGEKQPQKHAISEDKRKTYCLYRRRMLHSPNPLLKVPIHPWQWDQFVLKI